MAISENLRRVGDGECASRRVNDDGRDRPKVFDLESKRQQ